MRILYLGNNRLGFNVLHWLRQNKENIVGLVIHPPDSSRYREEIIEASGLSYEYIFDGSRIRDTGVISSIKALEPDMGISIMFGYILKDELLNVLPRGCINLHPAYLPYNRGAYPNVWSIVDGTPAGVTIHAVDRGVDTGPVFARQEVEVEPIDTGLTLYRKLEQAGLSLFQETWPLIKQGGITPTPQASPGSSHHIHDADAIDCIELDRAYTARELINTLRARTFPPHRGAYFIHEGRKIHLRLELTYEDEKNNR